MAERIKQPPVFNFIMRSVLLEHPGRLRSCVPRVLSCVTLRDGWELLGWDGAHQVQSPEMGLYSVPTGVIRQWPGQGRHLFGAAGTTLTCSLSPSTETPALHQGAPQGLGLSGFQAQPLKCGKAWKIGQRVRQGIVIFLKMLRELQCASDCDSSDVKILRSPCPVHQDYH